MRVNIRVLGTLSTPVLTYLYGQVCTRWPGELPLDDWNSRSDADQRTRMTDYLLVVSDVPCTKLMAKTWPGFLVVRSVPTAPYS